MCALVKIMYMCGKKHLQALVFRLIANKLFALGIPTIINTTIKEITLMVSIRYQWGIWFWTFQPLLNTV